MPQRGIRCRLALGTIPFSRRAGGVRQVDAVRARLGGRRRLGPHPRCRRNETPRPQGGLGHSAKVATAKPYPMARNPDKKLICVYTNDHNDEQDVFRVAAGLRKVAHYPETMSYKTDDATLSGVYRHTGHTSVSKYRDPYVPLQAQPPRAFSSNAVNTQT
eukprot:TRINITY_DN5211_c0_g1_i2.p1 TRINITY_DN5211_c0_g1~~TRINITY_DN5211_c0_g1_i2.p1  ORF type:complete len:160 (-),score=11.67 TRINITY_DN5211_c0_g1_i2:78-557(-)